MGLNISPTQEFHGQSPGKERALLVSFFSGSSELLGDGHGLSSAWGPAIPYINITVFGNLIDCLNYLIFIPLFFSICPLTDDN